MPYLFFTFTETTDAGAGQTPIDIDPVWAPTGRRGLEAIRAHYGDRVLMLPVTALYAILCILPYGRP